METKEMFIKICNEKIHRNGIESLLKWLDKTDFYTAPASTKYHGAVEGGLLQHSLNVYNAFREEVINYQLTNSGTDVLDEDTEEKVAIIALFHDLCKANFYKKSERNQKNEQGQWEKVPYYTVEDKFAYGHGEKSVYLIERFIRLKTDEALSIRWHMGGFDEAVKGGSYALSGAWNTQPLAVLIHIADLKATYFLEG